jgi:Tfp pilus assembly protein FimT
MSQRGVSIMEAMVVVSVLAITALITTPPLLQWKRNAQLRSLTFQIASTLQLARNHSLLHRDLVVITFTNNSYRIFVDNGDGGATAGDWLLGGTERLLFAYDTKPGVELNSNFPSNRFRFKGFGRNQPGTVTVRGASCSQRTRIVINAIGRIRTELE